MEHERILLAAKEGDIQVLRTLRSRVFSASDSFGATAIHYAARNGKLECVKWLIDILGMTGKEKTKTGASSLHDAAATGQVKCVEYLIEHAEVSVDQRDHSGHTALHLAARFGWFDTVKWLLEKGNSSPNCRTRNRMTPVHFAASGGSLSCLQLLAFKTNYSMVNESAVDGTTPIYVAAQDGSFECLKYLQQVGGKCHLKSRDGMLPIHAAAQNGHLDCVGFLVENGFASVESRGPGGATPAHYAASQGHLSVLKWLNAKGDITLTDDQHGSPLHDAAEQGHFECVKFLVDRCGLDVAQVDDSGVTPVELAGNNGHRKCSDFLKIAAAKRAKAEKRLSGGLTSVSFHQVTQSSVSQKSDYGVRSQVLNSLNYNIHNGKTHSRKPGKDENTPKSTFAQHAPVSTVTTFPAPPHRVNSSELNGHPLHSPEEQSIPPTVSYTHLVTKPPPSNTLPLPDITDPAHTSYQNPDDDYACTQPEKPKKSYHLPSLKTIPSYRPVAPRTLDQELNNMDQSTMNNNTDAAPASRDGNGVAGTDDGNYVTGTGVGSDANPEISDIDSISNVFSGDLSSNHVKTGDDFEVRISIDKMYTNEVLTEAGEKLFASDENHLPDLRESPSSADNRTNIQKLSSEELPIATVPPPQHFANGKRARPEVKSPGTPSSRHSSFSTNHVATVDDVTGEPIPEWKRQVYLNKLKKQKEKEEEEQKNSEKKDPKKWEGIPKWRIPIMEKQEEQRLKRIRKFEALPEWKRSLLLRRETQF